MEHLGAKHCAKCFVRITSLQSHPQPMMLSLLLSPFYRTLCRSRVPQSDGALGNGKHASPSVSRPWTTRYPSGLQLLPVCLFSDTSWLIQCPLGSLIDSACSSPSRMVLGDPPPSQVLLWASAASSSSDLPSIPMRENVRGHPYWWPATSRPEGGLSQVRFLFCFISLWLRATRPLGVKSSPSLVEPCF